MIIYAEEAPEQVRDETEKDKYIGQEKIASTTLLSHKLIVS